MADYEHNEVTTDPTSGATPMRTQVCNVSMRIGLVGYWNFAPAEETEILAGAPEGSDLTLTLNRSSRVNNTVQSVAGVGGGWTTEPHFTPPGRPTFNGCGTCTLTNELSLAGDGDAVTIAARIWPHGGDIQGGVIPHRPMQVCGLSGQYSPTLEAGLSLEIADLSLVPDGTFQLRQWNGTSAVSYPLPGSRAFADPMLAILVLERNAGFITATLYINGDHAGPTVSLLPSLVNLARVSFGDAQYSDGSITEAALWNRKLSVDEALGFAFDLFCVYGENEGGGGEEDPEEHPLLNDDGTSSVKPEWIVPLSHAHGTIDSEGVGNRHTRQRHERQRRQYGLRIRLGDGGEALILAESLRVSAFGAKWLRWRHPKDDPVGPWESAPRYRVANAGDASIALARSAAGICADFTLVLEDV